MMKRLVPHLKRVWMAILFLSLSFANAFGDSTSGAWSEVMAWNDVPIHASLLPTGEVLTWSGNSESSIAIWNPKTNTFMSVSTPGFNSFCAGHTFLPDGRLFVAGGNEAFDPGENLEGVKNSSIFNPWDLTWTQVPDMSYKRWYPSTTTMSTGEILVLTGRITQGTGGYGESYADIPEVYNWKTNLWRKLTGAKMTLPVYYPHTYQAPNGQAFYAQPATSSYYLSITNNGKWTKFATTKTKRDFGTGAMYDIGKVIVIGGRNGNTIYRSAEIINLATSERSRTSPQWTYTGSMGCQRVFLNSTILPDGKVLVTGGIKVLNFDPVPNQDVCFSAEMWDPATGKFTTMASMTEPRWYHSVALLLPDGTVLVGGGNEHPTAEIYSPPYLFKGTRPTINTYPTVAQYGQKFNITTSNPTDITRVTFLGLGSVTHGYNQSQRYMTLSYSRTSTGFTLTAPSSKNNAPPGYYLLFVLNKSGVPSEGKIIQLM